MSGPPRIIAEIGTAHDGDLGKARELIFAARDAGADVAKFQYVIADEILHPATGPVDLPGGAVSLFERFRVLERPRSFYEGLARACSDAHITFLCTPFGIASARALRAIGVEAVKIASPELNHHPLLEEVRGYRVPLLLSAGVATLEDIAEALGIIDGMAPTTLLHCITSYPAPEEEYNLRVIPSLRAALGVEVGISDHSLDPVLVPALATLMGATAIEKHLTLSRGGPGLDDPIALEPDEFAIMARRSRSIAEALRAADRRDPLSLRRTQLDMEILIAEEFGAERVERVLGDGVKRLAQSERRNYGFTNRSIHAQGSIASGEVLGVHNLAILRTERNLTPGIHPRYWRLIQGRPAARPVEAGAGITWDDLLPSAHQPPTTV